MTITYTIKAVDSTLTAYLAKQNVGAEAFRLKPGEIASGTTKEDAWLFVFAKGKWGWLDSSKGGGQVTTSGTIEPPPPPPPPPVDPPESVTYTATITDSVTGEVWSGILVRQ